MPSKEERIKVAQATGALQAGKLPSQKQVSKVIDLILKSDTLKSTGGEHTRTARLGPEGQRVLENVKSVLAAGKAWGEAKNGNDLLQNFFYNAATSDLEVDASTPHPPPKKELSRDAQRAMESFRTIASLIVTNPAFRQLGSDAILLTRDLFADVASAAADQAKAAAEKSRPSQQERKEGVDFDALQKKGKKTAKGVKSGKIQAEARESIWDEVEKAKQWADDNLPEGEEARDRMITKLQEVITSAQENPDYKRSITTIVNLVKKYTHKAEEALDEAKKTDISDEDEKIQQAGRDLKQFVEKVSNKSLDEVIAALRKVGEDVQNNDKLGAYFNALDQYLDRLLYQPGYVASRQAYNKASSLYDDGKSLLTENDEFKRDAGALQEQLEALVDGISNDGPTNDFINALENLADSFATAGQIGLGSLKIDGQGLYRDFADVILPRLVGLIKEIPLPRIEYKSEEIDLVIDDINLESASFIPDSIRFVQNNDLRFTQGYATYASEYDGSMRLRVQGLHLSASNIAFWVHRKTGMTFEDAGLLDFDFGPQGITFDVTLENADEEDQETFFTVKSVEVQMPDFDYSISKNSAWFATWFAKPIIRAFVKRNMTDAIEAQIAEYLRQADFRLYGLQQRAIAAANAKPSASNFISAIVNDSIFPRSSSVSVKSAGVVKYGRRGEYILHVGVDEELFPDQPPSEISNSRREKLKQTSAALTQQARGAVDQFKADANKTADKGKKEANELDARKKEQQRREERTEGWRSDAFDV
ncbi:hypothetical protein BCR39DRAFT_543419 [Naematelia encephala]|uniref:HAM1-like N-terminal domain-containing protein n=1 Tax=Naematelia encephala TaxID=71784 RepID=A0A1Y2ASV6_9TREE|nr:hypothetical protein BCR39DRAFT_543419 [Naematelia encephala]